MALLQSVESLRIRLGLSDIDDVNSALEGALEMATASLQASIRTDLVRATVVDTFFVKNSLEFPAPFHGRRWRADASSGGSARVSGASSLTLKLSRGFIDSAVDITAFAAPEEVYLTDSSRRQDLEDVGSKNRLTVSYEKGVARIQDYSFQSDYVQISYTAGLNTDGSTPDVYTGVPVWLRETALIKAQILINSNPVYAIQRGERDGLTRTEIISLQATISTILLSKSRYSPMARKPIFSVVTEI